jgi:hypothetical protein
MPGCTGRTSRSSRTYRSPFLGGGGLLSVISAAYLLRQLTKRVGSHETQLAVFQLLRPALRGLIRDR